MTIELNGKTYPLNFGMASKAEIYSQAGLNFTGEDFGKTITINFETMLHIAHIGLKHGARVNGQTWPHDYYETADMFDDNEEKLAEIVQLFSEAMADQGNAKSRPKAKKAQGGK